MNISARPCLTYLWRKIAMIPSLDDIHNRIASSKKGRSNIAADVIHTNIANAYEAKAKRLSNTPMPAVDVSEDNRKVAEALIRDNKVLVHHIRRESKIMTQYTEIGKPVKSIVPGVPIAALVAFVGSNGIMIGWSKRNSGVYATTMDVTGKTIGFANVEPFSYTKKFAVKVAVLRALSDRIHVETESQYLTKIVGISGESSKVRERVFGHTDGGETIPDIIMRELPDFVIRAIRWFKQMNGEDPVNVSHFSSVKNLDH